MMTSLLASFTVRRVRWVQSVVLCSLHVMPKVARISPALNTCNCVRACVRSHSQLPSPVKWSGWVELPSDPCAVVPQKLEREHAAVLVSVPVSEVMREHTPLTHQARR